MDDLGEALELMYVAPYLPFSTLRATAVDTVNETLKWRSLYAQATGARAWLSGDRLVGK